MFINIFDSSGFQNMDFLHRAIKPKKTSDYTKYGTLIGPANDHEANG